jgi:hypothetical protein
VEGRDVSTDVVRGDLRWPCTTSLNTPAPRLSISQKALETVPEVGNVMPKHVGTTIYN